MSRENRHIGSTVESFLLEDDNLYNATEKAMERVEEPKKSFKIGDKVKCTGYKDAFTVERIGNNVHSLSNPFFGTITVPEYRLTKIEKVDTIEFGECG